MFDPSRLIAIAGIACCLSLAACNTEPNDAAPPTPSGPDYTGHTHGDASNTDHSNAGPLPDSNAQADPHAGERHSLGTLTVAGGTFAVSMTGEITPSTELHFDITQTIGPPINTLRLWIGDKSATGSLKSKSTSNDGHFHAHVEAPITLSMDSALWIEANTASGDRELASIELQ
jgi:hypothetical protein